LRNPETFFTCCAATFSLLVPFLFIQVLNRKRAANSECQGEYLDRKTNFKKKMA
jgi:hypothetical protein